MSPCVFFIGKSGVFVTPSGPSEHEKLLQLLTVNQAALNWLAQYRIIMQQRIMKQQQIHTRADQTIALNRLHNYYTFLQKFTDLKKQKLAHEKMLRYFSIYPPKVRLKKR